MPKVTALLRQSVAKRLFAGAAIAAVMFSAMGTVTALWDNPIFTRMTPVGGWEVGLLALLSLLGGLYVVVRRPYCPNKAAGAGGVLGFLGVACPVCNKILLLLFGSELPLAYYEPIRLHIALAGVIITVWAVLRELRLRKTAYTG